MRARSFGPATGTRGPTPPGAGRRGARAVVVAALALASLGGSLRAHDLGSLEEPEGYWSRHWTIADGLPGNTINDAVLPAEGSLWLATFGGLARFDGESFRILEFATEPALPSNRITALAKGPDGALWFAALRGAVGRVEKGRVVDVVMADDSFGQFVDLLVTENGAVFVLGLDGTLWRTEGARLVRVLEPVPPGVYQGLARDGRGGLFAVHGRAIVRLDPPGRTIERVDLDADPTALAADGGGGFYVGREGGLAHRGVDGFRAVELEPPIRSTVRAIAFDPGGGLWFSADDEISRIVPRAADRWIRTAVVRPGPGESEGRVLTFGGGGSLWVGTAGSGLFRLTPHAVELLRHDQGRAGVTAVAPDGAGGAFYAASCRGLFRVAASGSPEPYALPRSPGDPESFGCEYTLAADLRNGRRRVWVRSAERLWRIDGGRARGVTPSRPLGREGGPIAADPDGSLWVTSYRGDVRRFDAEGRFLEEVRLARTIGSATPDGRGGLWLGSDDALLHLVGDRVETFGAGAGIPRGTIRQVLVEPDGVLWMASYGSGIVRFANGAARNWTVADGLHDNAVSALVADSSGALWASTNHGLMRFDRTELEAIASGGGQILAPVVLGFERGVPEANYGLPGGFLDAAGRVWFATTEGVVRVDASKFPFNDRSPEVRFEGVTADERPLPVGSPVRIPHGTSRVRVAFSSVALDYPERIRFRFRIEDRDEQWIDLGTRRSVNWNPPGPGVRTLLVEARNEDGIWSAGPARLELDVLPAWWERTGVRLVAFFALALAVGALDRLRVRLLERRHRERIRSLQAQRQAEQAAAEARAQLERVGRTALAGELAAGLAHEVNQPLAAIVANAQAGRRFLAAGGAGPAELDPIFADIAAQGRRASNVIGELRRFLRANPSGASRTDLARLVEEMQSLVRRELAAKNVAVTLALAPDLPPVSGPPTQIGQIVVNLLMNAIDALAKVDGPREIRVEAARVDDGVELTVADNGPGFPESDGERSFEPFVTSKAEGMGMGLAISRSIAEAHGGRLVAGERLGGGARLVLTLPVALPPAT